MKFCIRLAVVSLLASGCGMDPYPSSRVPGAPAMLSSVASQCGGLSAEETETNALPQPAGNYCDAEVLSWIYDAATETLAILDARAFLNCCGEHSITASVDESTGTLVIEETDDLSAGECNCMCVFDFGVHIQVEPGVVAVSLVRTTIAPEYAGSGTSTEELWIGELDLSQDQGQMIIDDSPAWSCQEPVELSALFGRSCALEVDRVWDRDNATEPPGFPFDPLAEVDYVVVEEGATHDLAFSAEGDMVEVGETPLKGGISEADEVTRFYDLSDGTFAGGRFIVWIAAGGFQGELTIYGSGVPIVSSERGPVTCE